MALVMMIVMTRMLLMVKLTQTIFDETLIDLGFNTNWLGLHTQIETSINQAIHVHSLSWTNRFLLNWPSLWHTILPKNISQINHQMNMARVESIYGMLYFTIGQQLWASLYLIPSLFGKWANNICPNIYCVIDLVSYCQYSFCSCPVSVIEL